MAVAAALVASVGVTGATVSRNGDPADSATVALGGHDRTARADRSGRDDATPATGSGTGSGAAVPKRGAGAGSGSGESGSGPAQAREAGRKRASTTSGQRTTTRKNATPRWVNPMPQGRVTSCYGLRWGRLHAGVDLAAPSGTPVRAAGAGRVRSAGANYGGYGISVLIEHDTGYLTHYAHLSSHSVRPGDRVSPGETIGREGSTGNSTGPHLHFEVHKGVWRNTIEPTDWLRERGIDVGC